MVQRIVAADAGAASRLDKHERGAVHWLADASSRATEHQSDMFDLLLKTDPSMVSRTLSQAFDDRGQTDLLKVLCRRSREAT
eukprot:754382-Rhodomonas_salina.1